MRRRLVLNGITGSKTPCTKQVIAENIFVGNLLEKWVDYKKLYKDTQDLLDQLGLQISPKNSGWSIE